MRRRLLPDGAAIAKLTAGAVSRCQLLALSAAVLALAAIGLVQYQRHAAEVAERAQDEEEARWIAAIEPERSRDSAPPSPDRGARAPLKAREVYAAWYDVPDSSLAQRRAGEQELTAAHNRLPIGTLVRVTHLENGKSVVVRITDRGIRDRRVKIDICKEAAEEIDMLRNGVARVRMEVMPDEHGPRTGESYTAAPHQ